MRSCHAGHEFECARWSWVVNLADRMLRVRPDGQGAYRLEVRKRDERVYRRLVDRLSQEFCFGIASDTARDAQILHMVREGARWRQHAPSPKQEASHGNSGCLSSRGGAVARSPMPSWRSRGSGMTRIGEDQEETQRHG